MTGVLARRARGAPGLVVVGAGIAGLRTVQTVRAQGYDGPIDLVGGEPHLPYDRPPLSKQVLTGELPPMPPEFLDATQLAALGVRVHTGVRAEHVDVDARWVRVGGERLPYSGLVLATGARPRPLRCLAGRVGVHLLRTIEDAVALRAEIDGDPRRIAVVGAGFIGAEVASSAAGLGHSVTVVEAAPVPMSRAVGPDVGRLLARLHQQHGVALHCGAAVTGAVGNGSMEALLLGDGSVVEADVVVVGTGVTPDVEWLRDSRLPLTDALVCDATLNAGPEGVYGAGDAVSWPNGRLGGRVTRSQQWTTAADQGRHAGLALVHGAEQAGAFGSDLYFWSDQYGRRIQGAGDLAMAPTSVLECDDELRRLVVAYRDEDHVSGVVAVNAPRDFRALRIGIGSTPWAEAVPAAMTSTVPSPDAALTS
jgi:3-phenylpropionate/trans-cinnamate dioxygenase ferredoxin reductase subunit